MPNNSLPYEVLGAPFDIYWGVVGTAFPLIDVAAGGSWNLIGTAGNLNFSTDGVEVDHRQATSVWRSLGDPGPRKVFRTEEDLIIGATLADVTLEQYSQAINGNTVTPTAAGIGTAGYKSMGLSRGLSIGTVALLVRGSASPYGAEGIMQYEIPYAQQSGSPKPVYRRDQPAMLALQWMALVDPNASSADERFGRIVAQHAVALT